MSSTEKHPATILVIEDDPAEIVLLRHALDRQEFKYTLEVLRDGEEALNFVQEHRTGVRPPQPCVILLDLHLPKYDGITVLRAIKQEPILSHIHVVVLTSIMTPHHEAIISTMDVSLCRQKPTQLSEFFLLGAEIVAICKNHLFAAI